MLSSVHENSFLKHTDNDKRVHSSGRVGQWAPQRYFVLLASFKKEKPNAEKEPCSLQVIFNFSLTSKSKRSKRRNEKM